MNDDEPNTYLLDHNPANLLPYVKRLAPEDPEAVASTITHHPMLSQDDFPDARYRA